MTVKVQKKSGRKAHDVGDDEQKAQEIREKSSSS
jgi:hypothetical protein